MPQLAGCFTGQKWPHLAADDLIFVVLITIPVHTVQCVVALHSWTMVHKLPSPPWTRRETDSLSFAVALLLAVVSIAVVMEIVLGCLSARGAILDGKMRRCVSPVFTSRLALLILQLLCATAVLATLLRLLWNLAPVTIVFKHIWFWEIVLLVLMQCVEAFGAPGVIVASMLCPTSAQSFIFGALGIGLKLLGTDEKTVTKVTKVLCKTVEVGDADLVISDVLFGLLLVRDRQQLCRLTSTTVAAAVPGGAACDGGRLDAMTTPLSRNKPADCSAFLELQRFLPYAIGVYGWSMYAFVRGVVPNTSVLSPCRAPCACRRVLPCIQQSLGETDYERATLEQNLIAVESDGPYGMPNACAFLRFLEENGHQVQMLYATWRNQVGEPPPHCIVRNDALQALVFVIRGTLSLQDCVSDMLATPKHIADVDEESDAFVHEGMHDCAVELIRRHTELLRREFAPGGPSNGYHCVCVGHSLGAGIAAFVALELRRSALLGQTHVRGICIEPPGGLLSPKLAKQTETFITSLVTADDWIPRLALRNVEILRERIIEELATCSSSKLALAFGATKSWICCCFRHAPPTHDTPMSSFRNLAELGTPNCPLKNSHAVDGAVCSEATALISGRKERQRTETDFWSPELLPPGRLIFLRSVEQRTFCCGTYSQDVRYRAEWLNTPSALFEIILSPKAMEHHSPNIVEWALEDAAKFLQQRDAGDAEPGEACVVELRSVPKQSTGEKNNSVLTTTKPGLDQKTKW